MIQREINLPAIRPETLKAQDATKNDSIWLEVHNGDIIEVEHNMTPLHVLVIDNLFRKLDTYVRAEQVGRVMTDGVRYVLEKTPDGKIRRALIPDLSYLSPGRIPADFNWEDDFEFAPDLAVEVMSRGQGNAKMLTRISDYLKAGSNEAWLIIPWKKTLYQYRANDDEPRIYGAADALNVTELFPGLMLTMTDIFAL